MRLWRLICATPFHRHSPCALSIPALADLSFALHGLSRITRFPMGHSPPGTRVSGDFLRAAQFAPAPLSHRSSIANGSLASPLAAILSYVPIRLRQTAQRRSGMAQSNGAYFSLRNTAVANVDWLVRASTPGVVSEDIHGAYVWDRIGSSISDFCSAPSALLGMRGPRRSADFYRAHWQLLFF